MKATRWHHGVQEGREECLEALYRLERRGDRITLEALRTCEDLRGIDTTGVLLDLIERGAVELVQGGIALKRAGRLTGRRIYRRHEIVEHLLRFFGLRCDRAHAEACRLEHLVSLPGERRHDHGERDRLEELFGLFDTGAVPLVRGEPGGTYRVALICAGRGARRKLEEMGVGPGAEVELCSGGGQGPVEIAVRGSRLAIGHGIASKLLVLPLTAGRRRELRAGGARRRPGAIRRHMHARRGEHRTRARRGVYDPNRR